MCDNQSVRIYMKNGSRSIYEIIFFSFQEACRFPLKITPCFSKLRVRDSKGYCAIHYASERNEVDTIQIIDVLIRYGAYIYY